MLFRYDDVYRVLRDPSLSVEERHATPLAVTMDADIEAMFEERREGGTHTMLNLDPPDHHRLRRLVSKVFTPRTVEELHPRVQQLVDEHLDAVAARGTGEMDLIADLAFPLPFVVISEMLGIPEGRDRNQLREWSGAVVKTFDPILTREEQLAAFDAIDNIVAYVNETIEWKRAHPGRRPAHRADRGRRRRRPAQRGGARRAGDAALRRRPRDDGEPDRQRHARAAAPPRPARAAAVAIRRSTRTCPTSCCASTARCR